MSQTLDIYFAFPDATLTYDCRSCGAQCCRGKDFYLSHRELDVLSMHYPGLELFAAAPPNAAQQTLAVVEPPPQCFFLDDGGRCRVENQLGRRHKPTACRLFPFNWFMAFDNVLTVGFADICPVELWQPGGRTSPVEHAHLAAELQDIDDLPQLAVSPPKHMRDGFRAGIQREQQWCRSAAVYLRDAKLYEALSTEACDAVSIAADQCKFLGLDASILPSLSSRRAILSTLSFVRLNLLRSGRVTWQNIDALGNCYLVALSLFVAQHERLSARPVTPATVGSLAQRLSPLLWNLCHLDRPVRLRDGIVPRVSPQLSALARQLMEICRQETLTLRETITVIEPEPRRRASLLRGLGTLNEALNFG
jgi:hypothetical protein